MARTIASDPLQGFRFKVEIDGFSEAIGFTAVEGLQYEIEVTNYREGGYTTTHKLPGIANTNPVTLRRGVFRNLDMYNFFRDALTKPNFRRTVTIIEMDRLGTEIRRWVLYEAWASRFTAPNKDANSSDVSVDEIEIQYEDMEAELA